mmetsp:Transcript_38047/g.42890  ORF Transcript_38047/g.42890 Transcript_38047/m.42890 type:complete len:90 (+) Transcript_38047:116-385(+)
MYLSQKITRISIGIRRINHKIITHTMLRRSGAVTFTSTQTLGSIGAFEGLVRRVKSGDDVRDVIGIDWGTVNSCVSIMVRKHTTKKKLK